MIVLTIIAFLGIAFGAYYFKEYQKAQALIKDPTELSKRETKNVLSKLSQLMDLPNDEEPTVATVTNKAKLNNQPFFAKAENGDKVVIYVKAKKAILYRPSTHRIIDVAPVNLGKPQGDAVVPTESISPTPTRGVFPTRAATVTVAPTQ